MLMSPFAMAALLAFVAPQAEKPKTDAVTVRGRVLGPDGKPVKDARLYWPRLPKTPPRSEQDVTFPQRAKTDTEGRFRFELPRADVNPQWHGLALIAAADGYGIDWAELPKDNTSAELTLRLVKDQPIEGRLISTEGKPLAGVRVRTFGVSKASQERLDNFLAAWKQDWQKALRQQLSSLSLMMFLPQGEKSSQSVTDKDGRFRLRGVGAERLVLLRLRGPGISQVMLYIINRGGFDAAAINKVARERTPSEERRPGHPPLLYGPVIEYVALAGRRIEGVVREAGSGKAVPNFVIQYGDSLDEFASALTDINGRYHLNNIAKKTQHQLIVAPPPDSSWLRTGARVEDKRGLQALQVDITVARGILVSGRIVDRATGKGVESFIRFMPLPVNTFAGKPGYDAFKYEDRWTRTSTDGHFQLAVMPGPGVLMVQARGGSETANGGQKLNPYKQAEFDAKDREYVKITESDNGDRSFTTIENKSESLTFWNAVKVLDLAADAGTATCDLFLERGQTRTIRIEDADGKPLRGATVSGVTALGQDAFTIEAATCTIFALDPKKPRRLFFLHPQRQLTGTLTVRGDEKEPPVACLRKASAVTGCVLDHDGQPLVGADINLIWRDSTSSELYDVAKHRPTARTDKDGRFRIEGIMPEVKFTLGIMQGRTFFISEPPIGVKQIKPDETLDLGDIRVKPFHETP